VTVPTNEVSRTGTLGTNEATKDNHFFLSGATG
jgi:hypothetical protein